MSPHAQQDHQRSNPTHYIYTFKATDKNAQSNAIPAYRPDTRIKADSAKSTGSRTPHEVVHEEPRHIKVVPRPIAVPVRKSILRLVPGEERGDIEEVERAIAVEGAVASRAARGHTARQNRQHKRSNHPRLLSSARTQRGEDDDGDGVDDVDDPDDNANGENDWTEVFNWVRNLINNIRDFIDQLV